MIKIIAMKDDKQIVVEINGGKTTISPTGYTGTACELATAGLEAALGIVKERTSTPEADLPEQAHTVGQS